VSSNLAINIKKYRLEDIILNEFVRNVLKTYTHNSIEAMLICEYFRVIEMIRELDKEGWVWREAGKVHINRNTE
jgi:hypothetical protein